MSRIVCWFSCGAASAVATKLAIAENAGRLPLVVARCIVREEHPDNDRFAAECSAWFGTPITELIAEKYDGSVFEVIRRESYISGVKGAPCTRLLKKEVRQRFELPSDRHVFGYTADSRDMERWDLFLYGEHIARAIESTIRHSADAGAAGVPQGWKLVPIEPTPEMVAAYLTANDAYWRRADELPPKIGKWRIGSPSEATAEGYRAMLSTSPTAPALQKQQDDQAQAADSEGGDVA